MPRVLKSGEMRLPTPAAELWIHRNLVAAAISSPRRIDENATSASGILRRLSS
jgi:hypothetical protein